MLIKKLFVLLTTLFYCGSLHGEEERPLTLVIIRHGSAEHNLEDVYNSTPSHPKYKPSNLIPSGISQVEITADKLLQCGICSSNVKAVYVSPLPRTLQSAKILFEKGVAPRELIQDSRLIEVRAGDLEGLSIIHEWKASYAKQFHSETEEEMTARVFDFYNNLRASTPSGVVIVVTHRLIAQKLLSLAAWPGETIPPGEAIIVSVPSI